MSDYRCDSCGAFPCRCPRPSFKIPNAIAAELEAQAKRMRREAKKFGEASRVYELRFQATKLERRAKRLRKATP